MLSKVCLHVFDQICGVLNCCTAHTSAYAADILHHDVSMGNILIAKDGRGLLIDWEMALDKNSLGPDRYDRARQRRCGELDLPFTFVNPYLTSILCRHLLLPVYSKDALTVSRAAPATLEA